MRPAKLGRDPRRSAKRRWVAFRFDWKLVLLQKSNGVRPGELCLACAAGRPCRASIPAAVSFLRVLHRGRRCGSYRQPAPSLPRSGCRLWPEWCFAAQSSGGQLGAAPPQLAPFRFSGTLPGTEFHEPDAARVGVCNCLPSLSIRWVPRNRWISIDFNGRS